jgi:large subunit ribosomal protein L35
MRIAKVDITAQVDGRVQQTGCLLGQRRGFHRRSRHSQDDGLDPRPDRSAAHKGKENLPVHEAVAFPSTQLQIRSCHPVSRRYLARPMPKPIARSKTRKSVAKRFKVTASGKVLRSRASRRHLMSAKNAKKKRQLAKMGRVHETDVARIKANLPFG